MKFLERPPRFLFFTGKGGVGKTSIACATAVQLAESGRRVLLVSTDPASNVGQFFGASIGNTITAVPGVPRLSALEIDPQAAAQAYRDRIVGPVRGVLPDSVVRSIEEQLSGGCTTEIAAFDEFTALLIDSTLTAGYEHIVFDTAPTGHTIRLLQLPGAWSGFLEGGKGDASCLGPLAGLEKQRTQYKAAVDALADPQRTRLVLVARAQPDALNEAARTRVIREASKTLVVMDTAPTGHTLLLLDATGAYHREITRQMGNLGSHFVTPMMQLQDPKQTKVILVALAETTPVLEAAGLQADLRRAGIEPWAWIINNSVAAALPHSPFLRQRANDELREIEAVATRHARRYAVVPMLQEELLGVG
jgi:TRC40/GET3/ArsA family transport-energizing ATPase